MVEEEGTLHDKLIKSLERGVVQKEESDIKKNGKGEGEEEGQVVEEEEVDMEDLAGHQPYDADQAKDHNYIVSEKDKEKYVF